jgi:hypothetical protein
MRSRTAPSSTHRISRIVVPFAVVVAIAALPIEARAISGLYGQVAGGYGQFSGDGLIVTEDASGADLPLGWPNPTSAGAVPGGLGFDLRLGFSFFGIAGELGVVGEYFSGGAGGIYGGGIRLFPLDVLSLVGLESDLPIDLSLGALFGPTIVGKDFAYTGVGIALDFAAEFKVSSFFSAGLKFDLGLPVFSDFVFTDYKNDTGRCLDAGGDHVVNSMNPGSERVKKADADCKGNGPSSTYIGAPLVVLTFHFNPLE